MNPDRPHVRVDPTVANGEPAIKGVPVGDVADRLTVGESLATVADEYRLTRPDVLVALWYLGRHGTKPWQRLYGTWAEAVDQQLWRGDYEVPDPPIGGAR